MLVPQEISHLQIGRWHLLWDWKLQKRGGITKSGVPFMGGSQTNFQDGIRTGISFFNIKRFLCLCRFPFNIHPIMRQIVMDGKIYSRAIWHLQLSVYVMIYFRRNLRDPNYSKCHFMEMSIHELPIKHLMRALVDIRNFYCCLCTIQWWRDLLLFWRDTLVVVYGKCHVWSITLYSCSTNIHQAYMKRSGEWCNCKRQKFPFIPLLKKSMLGQT